MTEEYKIRNGRVTIPYGVTEIGAKAFSAYRHILTSIEIPNSVTKIGNDAFFNCSGLITVEMPDSVIEIGDYAFYGCSGLSNIKIPYSVTEIGKGVFRGCGLTSIEIPNSVTEIGEDAFFGCSYLTSIEIPNSVTEIGKFAFWGCNGLTSIKIPDSVTKLGVAAFSDCNGLKSLNVGHNNSSYISIDNSILTKDRKTLVVGCKNSIIPDSVTEIGACAFCSCNGLTSIEIPKGVTKIGRNAFTNCSYLIRIEIPNSVTEIGDYAFTKCGSLTSIEIPSCVTEIGKGVFMSCNGLTSIKIPDSVTKLGVAAFSDCNGLKSLNVDLSNSSYISIDNSILTQDRTKLVAGCKNSIIPDSVTEIGDYAFDGCSGLTSIKIPNSVTKIGKSAFHCCWGLTSIEIPNGITDIGDCAFAGCIGLTSIGIPDSVTEIGDYAFDGCFGLTSIKIPNSVTKIGKSAFAGCNSLTKIEIAKGFCWRNQMSSERYNNLSDIYLNTMYPDSVKDFLWEIKQSSSANQITLHVPIEAEYAFRSSNVVKGFKEVIAENWKKSHKEFKEVIAENWEKQEIEISIKREHFVAFWRNTIIVLNKTANQQRKFQFLDEKELTEDDVIAILKKSGLDVSSMSLSEWNENNKWYFSTYKEAMNKKLMALTVNENGTVKPIASAKIIKDKNIESGQITVLCGLAKWYFKDTLPISSSKWLMGFDEWNKRMPTFKSIEGFEKWWNHYVDEVPNLVERMEYYYLGFVKGRCNFDDSELEQEVLGLERNLNYHLKKYDEQKIRYACQYPEYYEKCDSCIDAMSKDPKSARQFDDELNGDVIPVFERDCCPPEDAIYDIIISYIYYLAEKGRAKQYYSEDYIKEHFKF